MRPSPNTLYANPTRGPTLLYSVGTPPRGNPTNKAAAAGSLAAVITPRASSGNPLPKITMPLVGLPVPGTSEPSLGSTRGASAESYRVGSNVEKLLRAP